MNNDTRGLEGLMLRQLLQNCKDSPNDSYGFYEQYIVPKYENQSHHYYIKDVPEADKKAFIAVISLIGLAGCILNIIQLANIIQRIRSKKKLAMDYFLISLTVGDFYRSASSIGLGAYLLYFEFDWRNLEPRSNTLCKLSNFGTIVSRMIGLVSMCIIAMSRLVAIRWPFMAKKFEILKLNICRVAITWSLVVAISIPTVSFANTNVWLLKPNATLLELNPNHFHPVYIDDPKASSCADYARFCTMSLEDNEGAFMEKVFWFVSLILYFVIPNLILTVCYTLIIYTLMQLRKERAAQLSTSSTPSFLALMDKRDREAITSSVLGGVYVIFCFPAFIYYLAIDSLPHNSVKNYDLANHIVSTIEFVTVITNPLIYTVFTPSFIRRSKAYFNDSIAGVGSSFTDFVMNKVSSKEDVPGAEHMVKIWDKKHNEDIQNMCYYHPNVLLTASYDGDIIVWSTETYQPACRLNFTESTQPLLGHDHPKKADSQRTLIAKKFDLARKAINPDKPFDAGKLRFIDVLKAKSIAADIADSQKSSLSLSAHVAVNKSLTSPTLAPPSGVGWRKKLPSVIRGSDDSSYETLPYELPSKSKTDNPSEIYGQMSSASVDSYCDTPLRCDNCFGFLLKQNCEEPNLLSVTPDQLCCCDRSSFLSSANPKSSEPSRLRLKLSVGPHPASSTSVAPAVRPKVSDVHQFLKGPQQMITSTCIDCTVALNTRKVDRKTAIVFSGGVDGWIRAWSIHYRGGLLGQFRGSHRPQDAVTCLAVDDANLHLITGDSHGYVKVWFIGDYCTKTTYTSTLSAEENKKFLEQRNQRYPYFAASKFFHRFSVRESKAATQSIHPPPAASEPSRTVRKPILLTSFRGHIKAVTSVTFANNYQLIITGAEDNNYEDNSELSIPADIRKVASPRTLRVLYGGLSKRWKLIRNGIMKLIGPWFRLGLRLPPVITAKRKESKTSTPASPKVGTPAESKTQLAPSPTKEEDLAIPKTTYEIDVETSQILGRSYKKTRHHKAMPDYPEFACTDTPCTVNVWSNVKTIDMVDVKENYDTPGVLVARDQRRAKYIQQLINARAAKRRLGKSVFGGAFHQTPSDYSIPENRSLTITTSPVPTKPLSKLDPKKRNPYLPAINKKNVSIQSRVSIRNQGPVETVTIDRLALEICEIMGEANEAIDRN